MATLEESLELVPAGPAREAFRQIREYFPIDRTLFYAIISKVSAREHPLPYPTVESSFLNPRQVRMQKRISDYVLEMHDQLEQNGYIDHPNSLLKRKRGEAPLVSQQIRAMIWPLMDWYQFKNISTIIRYIYEENRKERNAPSLSLVKDVIGGYEFQILTPHLINVHKMMDDMLRKAKDDVPYKVPSPYVFVRKGLNSAEPLSHFTRRALKELLGDVAQEDVYYTEDVLREFKNVEQLKSLVDTVRGVYGFSSMRSVSKQFNDVLDLEKNVELNDLLAMEGDIYLPNRPSHIFRKLFVVASILYDANKRGLDAKVNPNRLVVKDEEYMKDLNFIIRKGLHNKPLAEALSISLDIPFFSAYRYANGESQHMPLPLALRLKEFREKELELVYILDLSDAKRKSEEYQRFVEDYSKGRVLVITSSVLSSEDIRKLKEIGANYLKGEFFVYPKIPPKILKKEPELKAFLPSRGLFKKPNYEKLRVAFK